MWTDVSELVSGKKPFLLQTDCSGITVAKNGQHMSPSSVPARRAAGERRGKFYALITRTVCSEFNNSSLPLSLMASEKG